MITFTRVKQATSEFIKVLRYGRDDVITGSNILPHGINSKPTKNKVAIHLKTSANGDGVIIGYVDNSDLTKEGETRIYATDSNGVEKFAIMMYNDGTVDFGGDADNLVRYAKLETALATFKTTLMSQLTAALPTLVWTPANTSAVTLDISTAKINEVKCS